MGRGSLKKCFVPCCKNTSANTNKFFITVPGGGSKIPEQLKERRRRWFKAIGRQLVQTKSVCCEDHFKLQEDALKFDTYRRWGARLKMKPDVVPYLHTTSIPDLPLPSQITSSQEKRKKRTLHGGSPKKCRKTLFSIDETAEIENPQPGTSSRHTPVKQVIVDLSDLPELVILSASEDSSQPTDAVDTSFHCSSTGNSSDFEVEDNSAALKLKLLMIDAKSNSKLFLGLPKEVYHILKFIEEKKVMDHRASLIILTKIRLNESFSVVAVRFGVNISTISRVFAKNIEAMYTIFKPFVFWPDPVDIRRNLPIAFRMRYANLQLIIDCFEVAIQKPSDPVKQSLTWSNYKSANTIKFLISITPDGIINFISEGFGGRSSDRMLVEECNYLVVLPVKAGVLADRGFKQIQPFLSRKQATLYRPPSACAQEKLDPKDVHTGRQMASLRIHVERAIGRIREFHMISPYGFVEHGLVWSLDYVVGIVCGIINLQTPLIQ